MNALSDQSESRPVFLTDDQRALIRRALERNRQWEPFEDYDALHRALPFVGEPAFDEDRHG
jgi:hypothetical protein